MAGNRDRSVVGARRAVALCAALLLGVAAAGPAAAQEPTRTVEKDYVGVPPTLGIAWSLGAEPVPVAAGGSGIVFVEDGETSVSVEVVDDAGNDTLNVVAFWDGLSLIEGRGFCNGTSDEPIPAEATHLQVFVQTNDWFEEHGWTIPDNCEAHEQSLSGTVTLDFFADAA